MECGRSLNISTLPVLSIHWNTYDNHFGTWFKSCPYNIVWFLSYRTYGIQRNDFFYGGIIARNITTTQFVLIVKTDRSSLICKWDGWLIYLYLEITLSLWICHHFSNGHHFAWGLNFLVKPTCQRSGTLLFVFYYLHNNHRKFAIPFTLLDCGIQKI